MMAIPNEETLLKFGNTPGLCNAGEIDEVFEWLIEFNTHLLAYKAAFGEPAGHSAQGWIDKAKWYKANRFKVEE